MSDDMEESRVEFGIIKAIKKDGKGILLTATNGQDTWYGNNFFAGDIHKICKRGDRVKIVLNNKGFLEAVVVTESSVENASSIQNPKRIDDEINKQASIILSYANNIVASGKADLTDMNTVIITHVEGFKLAKRLLKDDILEDNNNTN